MLLPSQLIVRSRDYDAELRSELRFLGAEILSETPSTFWVQGARAEAAWADCVWDEVQVLQIDSIGDAQKKLRALSKSWQYFGDLLHRRGALIAEKLGRPKDNGVHFPSLVEGADLPAFTLADANTILYSFKIGRPRADGKIPFVEDRESPPSRAYLKLWEALTVLGEWPKPGERVVDLGASPGSWTWVLSELKSQVLSIDRAPLEARIGASPFVEARQGDAFGFVPTKMEWVFSDVICFPDKLYDYVQKWLVSGHCKKFVCNVKFTGEVDPAIVDLFRKIPHSRVLHMLNGKKEVTWIRHPKL